MYGKKAHLRCKMWFFHYLISSPFPFYYTLKNWLWYSAFGRFLKKGNRIYLLYVNLTRKWIPILAIIIFIIEQKLCKSILKLQYGKLLFHYQIDKIIKRKPTFIIGMLIVGFMVIFIRSMSTAPGIIHFINVIVRQRIWKVIKIVITKL